MRALIILAMGSWLAVGADLAAPAQAEEVPVYQNAEIVRVDSGARTLVYRDTGGEKTIAVDSAILPELAKLQRGDKVILTSRVVRSDAGETRFVTAFRRTTPSAGTTHGHRQRADAQPVAGHEHRPGRAHGHRGRRGGCDAAPGRARRGRARAREPEAGRHRGALHGSRARSRGERRRGPAHPEDGSHGQRCAAGHLRGPHRDRPQSPGESGRGDPRRERDGVDPEHSSAGAARGRGGPPRNASDGGGEPERGRLRATSRLPRRRWRSRRGTSSGTGPLSGRPACASRDPVPAPGPSGSGSSTGRSSRKATTPAGRPTRS